MNARREIISFWVGLGPSVVGERVREAMKLRKKVLQPNKISFCFSVSYMFLCFYTIDN